jgi:hypothetical protein
LCSSVDEEVHTAKSHGDSSQKCDGDTKTYSRIIMSEESVALVDHYIPCTSTGIKPSIEAPTDPTDTDEASIPTEPESVSGTTTTLKRKAAKRTCVTKLSAANIKPSPDEDTPARKKPRLQASLPAIAADADTRNASPDADVAAPVASPDIGTDPVATSPMQPNDWAVLASHRRWTPEEDTNLTTAVKTTCKKKYGEEYRTDGLLFPSWFLVERKYSVCIDGTVSWTPRATRRSHLWVQNGQQKRTAR